MPRQSPQPHSLRRVRSGEPAELARHHRFDPVPLDQVPESLRPLVAAGMAKDPGQRPTDARTFVGQLEMAASGAYGLPVAPDSASPVTVTSTPPVTSTSGSPVTSTSKPPVTAPPPPAPLASVCQPDGTGCTKAGTYAGPNAVISSNYSGFKVVWTSSVVQPYSSGVPLYWTAHITYSNTTSARLTLTCPGAWADAASVAEYMSGGAGDDGMVSAESTYCSKNPDAAVTVPPGGTLVSWATFRNVPWPGSAVAIRWGDAGTSANVYPFA